MVSNVVELHKLLRLFVFVILAIVVSGYLAYTTECNKNGKCPPFSEWLNGTSNLKYILVSLTTGVSFGIIDNVLLIVGIDSIDSFCQKFCPGSENPIILAGYGHTFSTVVSAFISTFIGIWISNVTETDIDNAPVWSLAVGMLLGSLFGIFISSTMIATTKK